MEAAPVTPRLASRVRPVLPVLPGLAACLAITGLATALARPAPVLGAPVLAIVLGVLAAVLLGERAAPLRPGAAVAAGPVLQLSVVLLGAGLPLGEVARTGRASLPVLFGTLAVALGGGWLGGRWLGIPARQRTLIGVGTGICGASAIAAVTAVIGAAEAEVAYAVATIFTFNVAAVLAFPAVGHLLGLSQHSFGLWAGTAVNDTSSVVAAARSYGTAATSYAVVVKLTRSLLIIPICLGLAVRRRDGRDGLPWRRMLPWFLVGFLLASALDTVGAVPASWQGGLRLASTLLITAALAGIALATRPATLRTAGARPLLLGGLLWLAVSATSLLLQRLTGAW